MRKHTSVFLLFARSTLYKLLLLILALAAVQAGLFWSQLSGSPAASLPQLVTQSRLSWVYGAVLVGAGLILCRPGCDYGAQTSYTLMRLSISEKAVFLWQWVCSSLCYLLLWAVETAILLLLGQLYFLWADPAQLNSQTIFLAFYRSDFLHAVLPLDDGMLWMRNFALTIGLGASAAIFSYRQRRGSRFGGEIIVLTLATAVFFPCGLDSWGNAVLLILLSLICAGTALERALLRKEGVTVEH